MPASRYRDEEHISPLQWRPASRAASVDPPEWCGPSATERAKAALLTPGFKYSWTRLAAVSGALILTPMVLWWALIRGATALIALF
jgi:hypothetical protein